MRIVFFTGKGGAGTSTVAAASALRAARRGTKSLLLSADATHSLSDVLGVPIGTEPAEPAGGFGGLYAARIDPQQRGAAAWPAIQLRLGGLFGLSGAGPVAAEEMAVLPGMADVLTLLAVRDHARSGRFDAIFLDCGPSAQALRLLATAESLSWYVQRMLPVRPQLARSAGPLAALFGGDAVAPDTVFDGLLSLLDDLRSVHEVLGSAVLRLVLTAETAAVQEARRTRTALALYGYHLDAVVVNRLLPRNAGGWGAARRAAQRDQLAAIEESFGELPIHRIGYRAAEPIGAAELAEVADEVFADRPDPLATGPAAQSIRVHADGAQFVLTVHLPLADGAEVSAARSGDDLVLTVAGRRRLIALPSVLRRCVVNSARFTPGRLRVRFDRDPALWPREVMQ